MNIKTCLNFNAVLPPPGTMLGALFHEGVIF